MIGSEEAQKPRKLLPAHESPETEADVFADRPSGGKTAAIPDTGTGKFHAQTPFHGENLVIKRTWGTRTDTIFKGRGQFLDAAAP